MHTVLVLTKHADDYARLIADAALPDLAVVASDDVGKGLARAGHAGILLGDPTRVREALPRMTALRWVQLSWAGSNRCSTRRCDATTS